MLYFLRATLGLGFAVCNFGLVLTQVTTATQVPTDSKKTVTIPWHGLNRAIAEAYEPSSSLNIQELGTCPPDTPILGGEELSSPQTWGATGTRTSDLFNCVSPSQIVADRAVLAQQVNVLAPYGEGLTPDRTRDSSQPDRQAQQNRRKAQVTSVSELSDVKPTDWAFQAVQSLVERYGCIEGYPDKTFRGNRAATRYELAAALNACLNQLSSQLGGLTAEDLATIKRLQDEFATELTTLRGRVDSLEARTTELEVDQFSTTTKLTGQALFAVAGVQGDERANTSTELDENIFFSERVRLIFDTSFTGKDLLKIRLQAGNTPDLYEATGTRASRFAFTSPTDNEFVVNQLEYRLPLGDQGTFFIEAIGFLDLFVPTLHPLDGDYDTVLSGFSLRSPIYFQSGLTGVGFNYNFGELISIGGGYLAGDPTAGDTSTGLFGGPYGALAQLTIRPTDAFAFALTYLRGYDNGSGNAPPGGFFGSQNATFPFGPNVDPALPPVDDPFDPDAPGVVPVTYNSYGFEAQYSFSPNFILSGWVGLTQAEAQGGANEGANADILYWAGVLSFPNLGNEGSLGGIIVGQPSKVTSNDVPAFRDPSTSLLIEAFYRYQVTDGIGITPGVIVITNPEHNDANDTTYVGVVRTTFSF